MLRQSVSLMYDRVSNSPFQAIQHVCFQNRSSTTQMLPSSSPVGCSVLACTYRSISFILFIIIVSGCCFYPFLLCFHKDEKWLPFLHHQTILLLATTFPVLDSIEPLAIPFLHQIERTRKFHEQICVSHIDFVLHFD